MASKKVKKVENLENITLQVSQQTRDVVEALLWLFGYPKGLTSGSSKDGTTLWMKNKRLELKVFK